MPDTADDKTRKEYVRYLTEFKWPTQITIFYHSYAECLKADKHHKIIKAYLRSKYRKYGFLARLSLRKEEVVKFDDQIDTSKAIVDCAYHTFFTNMPAFDSDEIQGLEGMISCRCDADVRVNSWGVLESRMMGRAETIYSGQPHDLKWFFQVARNPNRISRINKKCWESLDFPLEFEAIPPRKIKSRTKQPPPLPLVKK